MNCLNPNSPRHFPQCTTCSPRLVKFITRVPVNGSSVNPSELRRRLMMLCPDGIPSVFLGEDGRNDATEFPDCFLWKIWISLAGLSGLASASLVFELWLWVTGSVLVFFSCHFIISKVNKNWKCMKVTFHNLIAWGKIISIDVSCKIEHQSNGKWEICFNNLIVP